MEPAPGHVRQLNAGTPYSVDRADGSREIAQGGPTRPAQEDRGQRRVLLVAGLLIEVNADPPRRAGLIVVIPAGHDHAEVIKPHPVRAARLICQDNANWQMLGRSSASALA